MYASFAAGFSTATVVMLLSGLFMYILCNRMLKYNIVHESYPQIVSCKVQQLRPVVVCLNVAHCGSMSTANAIHSY
jgi:dipeptide/tripeptide permease